MKLLLQSEVAEIMRCSEEKVRRLRYRGKLAYLPGRPVMIDEADLLAYLQTQKMRSLSKSNGDEATPVPAAAWPPSTADARKWAMEQILLTRAKPRKAR